MAKSRRFSCLQRLANAQRGCGAGARLTPTHAISHTFGGKFPSLVLSPASYQRGAQRRRRQSMGIGTRRLPPSPMHMRAFTHNTPTTKPAGAVQVCLRQGGGVSVVLARADPVNPPVVRRNHVVWGFHRQGEARRHTGMERIWMCCVWERVSRGAWRWKWGWGWGVVVVAVSSPRSIGREKHVAIQVVRRPRCGAHGAITLLGDFTSREKHAAIQA